MIAGLPLGTSSLALMAIRPGRAGEEQRLSGQPHPADIVGRARDTGVWLDRPADADDSRHSRRLAGEHRAHHGPEIAFNVACVASSILRCAGWRRSSTTSGWNGEAMTRDQSAEARLLLLDALAVVVAVLIGRLWQLQMVEGRLLSSRSDRNRFREVDVAAPRGVIYDRNGKILARNRPSFTVAVVPAICQRHARASPTRSKETAVLDRLWLCRLPAGRRGTTGRAARSCRPGQPQRRPPRRIGHEGGTQSRHAANSTQPLQDDGRSPTGRPGTCLGQRSRRGSTMAGWAAHIGRSRLRPSTR